MKKDFVKFTFLCVIVFYFFSCSKPEDTRESSGRLYSVRFDLRSGLEIIPFPTKSIPGYTPAEPSEEGTDPLDGLLFDQVEYVLYRQGDTEAIKHISFTEENTKDDFGTYIYDRLEVGSYQVAVLAHSVPNVTFDENQANSNQVGDSFYAIAEFEVSEGDEDTEVSLVLKRVVARVEIRPTKAAPAAAERLIIQVSGRYQAFDIREGEATLIKPLKKSFPLIAGMAPENNGGYAFYYFVPTPASPGDTCRIENIRLFTIANSGDTIHKVFLEDIPIIRNHITRYTGSLYERDLTSGTFNLSIENSGNWKDTLDLVFK